MPNAETLGGDFGIGKQRNDPVSSIPKNTVFLAKMTRNLATLHLFVTNKLS